MATEKADDGYKTVIYCMSGIDVGCFATSSHWALKKAWAEESAIKAWNHRVNRVCKMPEYIEREAVLAKGAPIPGYFCNMISAWDVANLPVADVVAHAKWVRIAGVPTPYCSRCNQEAIRTFLGGYAYSEYCPKCGAKMDLE